jgi:hypothetical protein
VASPQRGFVCARAFGSRSIARQAAASPFRPRTSRIDARARCARRSARAAAAVRRRTPSSLSALSPSRPPDQRCRLPRWSRGRPRSSTTKRRAGRSRAAAAARPDPRSLWRRPEPRSLWRSARFRRPRRQAAQASGARRARVSPSGRLHRGGEGKPQRRRGSRSSNGRRGSSGCRRRGRSAPRRPGGPVAQARRGAVVAASPHPAGEAPRGARVGIRMWRLRPAAPIADNLSTALYGSRLPPQLPLRTGGRRCATSLRLRRGTRQNRGRLSIKLCGRPGMQLRNRLRRRCRRL